MILKVFQVDKIACVQYTCSSWSSSQFFMQFLQCCRKFSIIAVCVHVNHRRCNFAVSFECYDTEFIELMPHTWNLISLCEHMLCIYLPWVYDVTNFIYYIFLLKRKITLSLTAFCSFIVTSWTSVKFWRVMSTLACRKN